MSITSNAITELREKHNMTQQELADRLCVSRSLVSMWELGERTPDWVSVERMADLFNVSKSAIMPDPQYVFVSEIDSEALDVEINELSEWIVHACENDEGRISLVDSVLSKLPRKDKALFMSRYLLMKTCKAIAFEFGMNESSVRSRLARLRKRLEKGGLLGETGAIRNDEFKRIMHVFATREENDLETE